MPAGVLADVPSAPAAAARGFRVSVSSRAASMASCAGNCFSRPDPVGWVRSHLLRTALACASPQFGDAALELAVLHVGSVHARHGHHRDALPVLSATSPGPQVAGEAQRPCVDRVDRRRREGGKAVTSAFGHTSARAAVPLPRGGDQLAGPRPARTRCPFETAPAADDAAARNDTPRAQHRPRPGIRPQPVTAPRTTPFVHRLVDPGHRTGLDRPKIHS